MSVSPGSDISYHISPWVGRQQSVARAKFDTNDVSTICYQIVYLSLVSVVCSFIRRNLVVYAAPGPDVLSLVSHRQRAIPV